MDEKIIHLPNGLRVAYKHIPYTRNVHCGFIVDVGGRDDAGHVEGMAHFLEHILFKGTEKRKTFHLLNYIESVGGDVNAYTTKEKTCIYCSINASFFERAIDVLSDIVFGSIFPEKEIAKEQQVILEEIDMYRDAPDEAIFEDYDALLFPNHPLGTPILGTKESIPTIQYPRIRDFYQSFYTTDNIIFSVVGNISEKKLTKLLHQYLANLPLSRSHAVRLAPSPIQPSHQTVSIPTTQAHEILGGRAMSMHEKDYASFMLLQNTLGGPAMNTRLNMNIREKFGLAYNITSFYAPFTDCGLWGIYYACDEKNLSKIRHKVFKELKNLSEKPMGSIQIHQAKQQLIGQFLLANENWVSQMLGMGKELLDYGKLISLDEFLHKIEQVSAPELQTLAIQYFSPESISSITYIPTEDE